MQCIYCQQKWKFQAVALYTLAKLFLLRNEDYRPLRHEAC